jgi:hypothetical protein
MQQVTGPISTIWRISVPWIPVASHCTDAVFSTTVPGLGYVGLSNQWTYASATIRGVGPDAAYVVQQMQQQLRPVEAKVNERVRGIQRVFGSWRCCMGKVGAL